MITIIHGPMRCGKTYNRDRLAKHFKARRIVDSWEARTGRNDTICGPLQDGDLVLTYDGPDAINRARSLKGLSFAIIGFDTAIALAGGRRD